MNEPMLGTPLSASLIVLTLAVMWLVPVAFYAIVFSVGSGLGPDEESGTVHPISSKPNPKNEEHPVPHAA